MSVLYVYDDDYVQVIYARLGARVKIEKNNIEDCQKAKKKKIAIPTDFCSFSQNL